MAGFALNAELISFSVCVGYVPYLPAFTQLNWNLGVKSLIKFTEKLLLLYMQR